MTLTEILDFVSEAQLGAIFGLGTGIAFGVAAHRSAFCLRAAVVEFARGALGERMAVWFLTFSTALVWVQSAQLLGLFRAEDARMMAITGSWSGALIGGLMFGVGMVLSRGCSGRLLVLAATGNLRSLIAGLVFAVTAQMTLHGWLSPFREWIVSLSTTNGGQNLNLIDYLALPDVSGLVIGAAFALVALALSIKHRIGLAKVIFASGVGFSVALGWVLTFALAQVSFDPVTVTSATFSGPSASTLMYLLTQDEVLSFDIGLVPGVFFGAFTSSILAGNFRFQGFEGEGQMRRSLSGAVLMGFGAMLAGGCAIGAGVSGGSIFAGTAWLALFSMWIGGAAADWIIDQRSQSVGATV